MKEILRKLKSIQNALIAPKNQRNDFGKYKYRSCEDILNALKDHLNATNTALTITDDIVQINERFYVKATATLYDIETAESISSMAFAREPLTKKGMDESQITGATSSYARKYALNGLFAIDDTKDADATNRHGAETPKNEITAEMVNELYELGATVGLDSETLQARIKTKNKIANIADLTKAQYLKIIDGLKKMPAKELTNE